MINMMHARNEDYPIHCTPNHVMKLGRFTSEVDSGKYDSLIDGINEGALLDIVTQPKVDGMATLKSVVHIQDDMLVRALYRHIELVFG